MYNLFGFNANSSFFIVWTDRLNTLSKDLVEQTFLNEDITTCHFFKQFSDPSELFILLRQEIVSNNVLLETMSFAMYAYSLTGFKDSLMTASCILMRQRVDLSGNWSRKLRVQDQESAILYYVRAKICNVQRYVVASVAIIVLPYVVVNNQSPLLSQNHQRNWRKKTIVQKTT